MFTYPGEPNPFISTQDGTSISSQSESSKSALKKSSGRNLGLPLQQIFHRPSSDLTQGVRASPSTSASSARASGKPSARAGRRFSSVTHSFSQSRLPFLSDSTRLSSASNTSQGCGPSFMSIAFHARSPRPFAGVTNLSRKASTAFRVPSKSEPWIATMLFLSFTNHAPFAAHGWVETNTSPPTGDDQVEYFTLTPVFASTSESMSATAFFTSAGSSGPSFTRASRAGFASSNGPKSSFSGSTSAIAANEAAHTTTRFVSSIIACYSPTACNYTKIIQRQSIRLGAPFFIKRAHSIHESQNLGFCGDCPQYLLYFYDL